MRCALFSVVLLATSISFAHGEDFVVDASCTVNGQKLTLPSMKVSAGKTASATATQCGYSIAMTVEAGQGLPEQPEVHTVAMKISRKCNGKESVISAPKLMTATGKEAMIAVGEELSAKVKITRE